ncbi:hypothetical protein C8Q75DRAFT_460586 [Abortiporus biennis]|nr:hypothetical protein C8Q75DRAFT_460586 [Abortiporus biennis]
MGSPESLPTAGEHLMAAKMFSLASCVMLFYDIVLTFGDEVERIWKQRFTGATILWFLNRYLSPLGYIVIIVSFHSRWPVSVCNRYVLYPEILKIFTAFTIGVIFILRLYAIYSRNRIILITFTILLFAELAVKIYAFTDGVRLDLPPEFDGCILTGRDADGKRIVYTWVAELIFDTSVFFATLYRTVSLYRSSELGPSSNLIRVIMRDGVVYFGVIFVSNLVTVLIFVAAPPDLKVVNATSGLLERWKTILLETWVLSLRVGVMIAIIKITRTNDEGIEQMTWNSETSDRHRTHNRRHYLCQKVQEQKPDHFQNLDRYQQFQFKLLRRLSKPSSKGWMDLLRRVEDIGS